MSKLQEALGYQVVNGTSYHADTSKRVIDIIERARANSWRLRLYLGDAKTGRDWNEHYDVTGRIGRSSGPVKVPILLHNSQSIGGGAILDHCIVRIRHANKRDGKFDLYRHTKYHNPESEQAREEDALEEADAGIGAKS